MKAIADRTTVTPFIGMLLVDQSVPWDLRSLSGQDRRGRVGRGSDFPPILPILPVSTHHAQAYASTRGSAPALRTPFAPTTMPPFEPWVHGPVTRILWPRATSA